MTGLKKYTEQILGVKFEDKIGFKTPGVILYSRFIFFNYFGIYGIIDDHTKKWVIFAHLGGFYSLFKLSCLCLSLCY